MMHWLTGTSIGFVICFCICFIAHGITKRIAMFNQLPFSRLKGIQSRSVAFVHALFVFLLSSYVFFTSERPTDYDDFFPPQTPLFNLSVGYFLFDLCFMIYYRRHVFQTIFLSTTPLSC
ncbi:hypothetical protein GEMRC1_009001 [Eukaryota sp. GEM-RC1]